MLDQDRLEIGERAILVSLDFGERDFFDGTQEFVQLVESANILPLAQISGKRSRPDAKYYAGTGKVQEIAEAIRAYDANLVLFNHALTPAQERNLERQLSCRVLDRTTLILDIFAQRAQSHEGKLQVELAQLGYLSSRLVRGWTHLERQGGGIGARGPGETQLETDRRLVGKRVALLKQRLDIVIKQRVVQRKARFRSGLPSVSIVGYTNAGKSTLFNKLTKADIYCANQLFATLDTTSRKLFLQENVSVLLADTVGFIRALPTALIAAFRATLEETVQADLLLHVVDVNHPMRETQIMEVNRVLKEIHADHIPQIVVWNKIDAQYALPAVKLEEAEIERDAQGQIVSVRVSGLTGAGLDLLRAAIIEKIEATPPVSTAPLQAWHPLD